MCIAVNSIYTGVSSQMYVQRNMLMYVLRVDNLNLIAPAQQQLNSEIEVYSKGH